MKKVSVICIDCEPGYIDLVLGNQAYPNLEVVEVATGEKFYQDMIGYCKDTDSEFICFLENDHLLLPDKIKKMVDYAEKMEGMDVVFCNRGYGTVDNEVLSYPDVQYCSIFKDTLFQGTKVLYQCMKHGRNFLGNLTTMMFRRDRAALSIERFAQYGIEENPEMQKTFLLFEILAGRIMGLLEEILVLTFVQYMDLDKLRRQELLFEKLAKTFADLHGWDFTDCQLYGISSVHRNLLEGTVPRNLGLKKEITFFATDKGEYYNLLPILEEARNRGYQVSITDNLQIKTEIGVYCQHVGRPENAKFSVVLLHDMAQGHNRWPNMWGLEPWSGYDMGILPGENWKERWEKSAFNYYAYPRCGAYMLGYPKSNQVFSVELEHRVQELKESLNFKYDMTVLYAPSWENDGKEDEFVKALSTLPINLLVKQNLWPEGFFDDAEQTGLEDISDNIRNMRSLHEGNYENLYYLEPKETIMVALKLCDMIVSDESSVMVEGMMFGKPSIGVTDWLIPDTIPKRFSSIPFENIY